VLKDIFKNAIIATGNASIIIINITKIYKMGVDIMEKSKKILEDLLLDIDILNELDKWTNEINFFKISSMENQEIKHSHTLAWFFDPNENHFIGDQVIRRFLQKVISSNKEVVKDLDIYDVSLIDYSSFIAKREWRNIDILLQSNELKIIFIIENKVYASESNDQLNRYFNIINKEFPDYKKVFIYLTREGEVPTDHINWCIADYKMIIAALEETCNSNTTISSKTNLIINDYIAMIRRNFGMDNELKKTAQKIYLKHKKAFDLIYEVSTNVYSQFSEYIKNWLSDNKLKYNINFNEAYSTNSIIRFTTPYIDEMFPFDDKKADGWNFGHSFMYEININKDSIHLLGVLSNFNRPNSKHFKDYNKNSRSKKWRRVMPSKILLHEDFIAEGLTDETVKKLEKGLSKILPKYIEDFEKDMQKHIGDNR